MSIYCRLLSGHLLLSMVSLLLLGNAWAQESKTPISTNSGQQDKYLSVDAAVIEALNNNPLVDVITARTAALQYIPERLGSLDDPQLSLNFANFPIDDFGTGNDPMTQIQLGISQKLPFPGKLALRKSVAFENAKASEWEIEEVKLQLSRQVKHMWWQIFFTDRALETVATNKMLLRQFVEIAQTKYRVGKGIQQDVLLAQLELSKLLEKEIQLNESRRNAEVQLNNLLHRPSLQAIALPGTVNTKMPKIMTERKLQALARASRPSIMAAQKRIDSAQQKVALAKREKYPDFRIAAIYGQRENHSDLASLQLGMSLPIFVGSKQAKLVDQRSSELLQASYFMQDLFSVVDREISMAITKYQSASEQARLFKTGIIPQAQQTVDAMRAGYQVNQVDFLNLVRTQITLYNYETQYWQSITKANQAMAQLVSVIGKESINE